MDGVLGGVSTDSAPRLARAAWVRAASGGEFDVGVEMMSGDEDVEGGAERGPVGCGDFEGDADRGARGCGRFGREWGRGEDEFAELGFVEAGEGGVEVGEGLKVFDQAVEEVRIEVGTDVRIVERDVESLLAFEREVDDEALDFSVAEMFEDFETLMTADDMAGALVPDEGLNEGEFAE
jgi:hypothetical protein